MMKRRFDATWILSRNSSFRDIPSLSGADLIAALISSGDNAGSSRLSCMSSRMSFSAVLIFLSSPLRNILLPRELTFISRDSSIARRLFPRPVNREGYSSSVPNSITVVFVYAPYSFLPVTNAWIAPFFLSLMESSSASFLSLNLPAFTL